MTEVKQTPISPMNIKCISSLGVPVISAPISSSRSIAARAVTPGENGAEEVEMLV